MNASAIKPNVPFATTKKLNRTPATENNKQIASFIDSHNFSFKIDEITKELKTIVTQK